MQANNPRQADIVLLARRVGRVDVEGLAEHFQVTPQTIRKDLNELCDRGLMQRFHGGAMLTSGAANVDYELRRQLSTESKHQIGERAAQLVPNDCSLLINIGTTTEQVAMALRNHRGMMVITNNINVVNILQGCPDMDVIVAGGTLRHADGGIVGEAAVEFIRQFRTDYAIMGVSAIDPDGSLLDFDYREVSVAKAILAGSRRSILVADNTKFSRSAPVRIGHISEMDVLVTDAPPPPAIVQTCRDNGVSIELVGESA